MLIKDKIIFIIPPLTSEAGYAAPGDRVQLVPPIGLLYLAANCRKYGLDVSIIDAAALGYGIDETVKSILAGKPKFVGFSANTLSISSAARCAKKLRELAPDTFNIIGGPHVSSCPERTMELFNHFDAGVIGEGEQTIVELIDAVKVEKDLERVTGIVYRSGDEIKKTLPREYIKDLDELPMPAWDLLPSYKAYKPSSTRFSRPPVGSIITSRGCPGECTFCDRSVFGRVWRGHGADYVLEMIKENIRRHHIRSLVINDDTFVINRKRLVRICERMAEERFNLKWSCSARINEMTLEKLQLMKKAGCFQIAYGIESGSQAILDLMKKKTSPDHMRKVIEDTRRAGIRSKGYFIIGHPGETSETMQETIDFALSVPLDDAQFTFLTPFPGTEVYQKAKESGFFIEEWEKMSLWETVFVPEGFTVEQMKHLQNTAFRKFYFRPRVIGSYARLALSSPSFSKTLSHEFLSFIRFVLKKK